MELINDNSVDVCCVTETWLKLEDAAKLSEIHDLGYDILSAPRRGKGGGVAFIFNPLRIKPIRNNVTKYSSFEVLECVIKSASNLIRLCVVYRSTQTSTKEKYNMTKSSLFLSQFGDYLDSLLIKGGTPLICGDFNFHVEDTHDTLAQQFVNLYQEKGLQQHVQGSTHVAGGTLDLILTRTNITDEMRVSNLVVEPNTGCTSDHYLLHFEVPFAPLIHNVKTRESKHLREFKKINIDVFKADIMASALNSSLSSLDLELAVELYEATLIDLLDKHAPVVLRTFKVKKTLWWNQLCQGARTVRRRAERAYRKHGLPCAQSYKESCVDAAIIINRERNRFYQTKLGSLAGNARETFKVVNHLLDKEYGGEKLPNGESDLAVAESLKNFFHNKVEDIYESIVQSQSPMPSNSNTQQSINNNARMTEFVSISNADLSEVIKAMPNKSCSLDIIPTWLLKMCLPELISVISFIVNQSLSSGSFPTSFKSALVRPSLKKPSLDSDILAHYRPISNLPFLSKVIRRVITVGTAYTAQYRPIPPNTAQYRPIPPNTAQYRPIPPNTAQYRPIPPNTAQYRPIPPNTAQYRPIPPNTAQYRPIPPNTAQYRPIPPNTAKYRQIPPNTAQIPPMRYQQ